MIAGLVFLVVLVLALVSVVVAVFEPVLVVFVAVAVAVVVSVTFAGIGEGSCGKAAYEKRGAEDEGQALLNDLLHGVLLFF